jgi:hypothetical protein
LPLAARRVRFHPNRADNFFFLHAFVLLIAGELGTVVFLHGSRRYAGRGRGRVLRRTGAGTGFVVDVLGILDALSIPKVGQLVEHW